MFGISFEHILILGIVLLVVGPRKLPELGNTLGKAIKNFKDAVGGIEEAKFRKIEPEATTKPTIVATETAANTTTSNSTTTTTVNSTTDQKPQG